MAGISAGPSTCEEIQAFACNDPDHMDGRTEDNAKAQNTALGCGGWSDGLIMGMHLLRQRSPGCPGWRRWFVLFLFAGLTSFGAELEDARKSFLKGDYEE